MALIDYTFVTNRTIRVGETVYPAGTEIDGSAFASEEVLQRYYRHGHLDIVPGVNSGASQSSGVRSLSLADLGSPANISAVTCYVERVGNLVSLRFTCTLGASWVANGTTAADRLLIPAGFRPTLASTIERQFGPRNGSAGSLASVYLNASGHAYYRDSAAATQVIGYYAATYLTADAWPDPMPGTAA